MFRRCVTAVVVLTLLGAATSALSGDLNPPGAPEPTPGPEPRTPISGLPFFIEEPGSYYLTGNLTGAPLAPGIIIASNEVTIDLMGFTLQGVPGSLSGIMTADLPASRADVTIINGVVRDWGGDGIFTEPFSSCRISGILATSNDGRGISVGLNATVVDCTAEHNGSTGIAMPGGVITRCTSTNNVGAGIDFGGIGVVSECRAATNGSDGFRVAAQTNIFNCESTYNEGDGIEANLNCRVVGNLCTHNGSPSAPAAGIRVTQSDNHIEGNTVLDNTVGIEVDVGGNLIIRNTASGNETNFSIAADNAVGAIFDASGIEINLTNPYRNLEF